VVRRLLCVFSVTCQWRQEVASAHRAEPGLWHLITYVAVVVLRLPQVLSSVRVAVINDNQNKIL
jgi:hypothetical protein